MSWRLHASLRPDPAPGEFRLSTEEHPGRADPVIRVSGQLLRELHSGAPSFVTLDCKCPDIRTVSWSFDFQAEVSPGKIYLLSGDTIKIQDRDRRIIYVVRHKVNDDPEIWEASWPD